LEAFYRALNPIIVPDKEIAAPNPTHFIVNYEGVETEWPIAAWDQDLNVAPTSAEQQDDHYPLYQTDGC